MSLEFRHVRAYDDVTSPPLTVPRTMLISFIDG